MEESVEVKLPGLGKDVEETKRTARILELVQMIATALRLYNRQGLVSRL